jgi:3-dehydroquinate synthase
METIKFDFSRQSVDYHFDASLADLQTLVPQRKSVVVTDQHIFDLHQDKFKGWDTIVLDAGEKYKVQSTIDSIILQLVHIGADRQTTLIGVGGGVVTDIVGYAASVFMRGIPFGFVPTSLLAMVDASIGGKNGIDVGLYKNMVGTINQPSFVLYDASFLETLPEKEWRNGFAEIIKHACIKDAQLFVQLERSSLADYKANPGLLQDLIKRNVLIKTSVVQEDEFEKGERRLLNFGHTLAHAIETQYDLMHGEAVAIGMVFASRLSQMHLKFEGHSRLLSLVEQYSLPATIDFDKDKVFEVLKSDKKKESDFMNFVLLQELGKATIEKIPLESLHNYL